MTASLHFGSIATRWKLVGPPLRPTAPDVEAFRRSISGTPMNVLILGVTPELLHLGWPGQARVQALDASREMVEHVWPGSPDAAKVGSWTEPPWRPGTFDLVICDGGFGLLRPGAQRTLLSVIDDLLTDDGQFVLRLFAPQGKTGSLDAIRTDLFANKVPSLDALKLRLWGALQESWEQGVSPRDVVAVVDQWTGDALSLHALLGWSSDHLRTLDMHRASDARYHLPSPEELTTMASSLTSLRWRSTEIPAHEFGECCPVVGFFKS